MSELHHNHSHAHGHDDHHEHDDHGAHGSLKEYVTGFVLSVILTAIPFWLVMGNVFENTKVTGLVIMAFAAVQVVVHMVYFLHMNFRSEGGWTMLALFFTVIILVIVLAGSLWVMYHMNHNMMPGMSPDAGHQMHDM
jgi:cytochrome o ubiquinol oxidase subunit IV